MIYLLIDTSTVEASLISDEIYSHCLRDLYEWVKTKQIKLLVPEVLKEEWEEHKNSIRKRINKKIQELEKNAQYADWLGKPTTKEWEIVKTKLLKQLEDYDEIVNDGLQIETTPTAKEISVSHFINGKIPFTRDNEQVSRKRFKDAFIILTALDFANSNSINEFYFLTNNYSDFAEPESEPRELHSDYLKAFPGVTVEYFEGSRNFRHKLFETGFRSFEFGKEEQDVVNENDILNENEEWNESGIELDQNLHIVDQLHVLFKEYLFKELDFVPLHVLSRQLPIQITGHSYFRQFTLETDNVEMFNFFKAIKWKNHQPYLEGNNISNSINNFEEKFKYINKKLQANLAYRISFDHESVQLHSQEEVICDCYSCKIDRFEFITVLNDLRKDSDDVKELKLQGHAYYKLEDFVNAAKKFKKARDLCGEAYPMTGFIMDYNLSKMKLAIPTYRIRHIEQDLVQFLEKVSLQSSFEDYKHQPTQGVVRWIMDEQFLSAAMRDIRKLVRKVRSQYLSSLGGGKSSNNYSDLLLWHVAKTELFVLRNQITFEIFSEYKEMIALFVEGYYASHSIRADDSDHVRFFNDWILKLIIDHLTADELSFLFRTYKLNEIKYSESARKELTTPTRTIKLIESYTKSVDDICDQLDDNNDFSQKYPRMIRSAIHLAGQCNYLKKDIKGIANSLIGYIELRALHSDENAIRFFLNRKAEQLNSSVLKKMWIAVTKNPRLHNSSLFHVIANAFENRKAKLKLTKKEFLYLKNFFTDYCNNCRRQHSSIDLVQLTRLLLVDEQRYEMTELIQSRLAQEFDDRLFYNSVIYELIDVNNKYFDLCLNNAVPRIKTTGPIQTKNRGYPHERYQKLDNFINLAFKLNVDLSQNKFDILRGYNNYYDWLLDMDNFDYEKWNPDWISEYGTLFYFRRMYQSEKLKSALEEYLQERESYNNDPVMKTYLGIFVRKKWKTKLDEN